MSEPINVYSTLGAPPDPPFPHSALGRRDRSDPELAPHLDGFFGFVERYGAEMTVRKMAVQRHILQTRTQMTLQVQPKDMAAFHAWMREVNGIYFLPQMSIHDPDGRVLIAPGDLFGDPAAGLPYPSDALARKAATDTELRAMGLEPLASLPPVLGEAEVRLRTPREAAARCLALTALAVTGELVRDEDSEMHSLALKHIPLAGPALSPWERAFIKGDGRKPNLLGRLTGRKANYVTQDIARATWRYEAVALLLWALGIRDELPFPDEPCQAGPLVADVRAQDHGRWLETAKLRPAAELLDALDLHYRLHWLTTEERVNGRVLAVQIDDGVVWERHWALNWLTRFDDADWDDISTPT